MRTSKNIGCFLTDPLPGPTLRFIMYCPESSPLYTPFGLTAAIFHTCCSRVVRP